MEKLYIAYGSNLNLAQMASRCPSARIYSVGVLNNWKLVYRGTKTNSHATIIRKKGAKVPVLVWTITPYDERNLDRYEGFPSYYYKQNIMVDIGAGKKLAMVYIMNQWQSPGFPSDFYIDIIREGYVDNGLDMRYLDESLDFNLEECSEI